MVIIEAPTVPLTSIAIVSVGSYYQGLYRNHKEPTTMMVLVADGMVPMACVLSQEVT